jgi:hypothetical protein
MPVCFERGYPAYGYGYGVPAYGYGYYAPRRVYYAPRYYPRRAVYGPRYYPRGVRCLPARRVLSLRSSVKKRGCGRIRSSSLRSKEKEVKRERECRADPTDQPRPNTHFK